MVNALLIDEKDDVIVAIEEIKKDSLVYYSTKGKIQSLTAKDDITIYHKIALRDIKAGTAITKYGEHIGVASKDIIKGMHVHEHNVDSVREEL